MSGRFQLLWCGWLGDLDVADALDLLDAWVSGELLGPERAATPDKFRSDDPNSTFIIGDGIPVNGYCDPAPAMSSSIRARPPMWD